MTPLMLQDLMVEKMKILFAKFWLKNAAGNMAPLNIYAQHLPVTEQKNDPAHYPYIVVWLDMAEDIGKADPRKCHLMFMTGVYDKSKDFQGYRDNANMVDRIYEYLRNVEMFESFVLDYPIISAYSAVDENGAPKVTYPYFFGGVETNWVIPKILPDDSNI